MNLSQIKNYLRVIKKKFQLPDYTLFLPDSIKAEKKKRILAQSKYFFPDKKRVSIKKASNLFYFQNKPLIHTNDLSQYLPDYTKLKNNKFNVDYEHIPFSSWHWHLASNLLYKDNVDDIHTYHTRFNNLCRQLSSSTVTVFGTGPTLRQYRKFEFQNGLKIFCNSMVKDKYIFAKFKPSLIVAADSIYHFGYNQYAFQFRKDLKQRLAESPNLFFIFPFTFNNFVKREFSKYSDRLIGIPVNDKSQFNINFKKQFYLPKLGNVLSLMLLPIACNFSRDIYLFGFDGKKPGDKLFWSHSSKHDYPELLKEIVDKEPAFIKHHFPTSKSDKYIRENLDKSFEKMLQRIEKKGFKITMMHPSYTKALAKRFKNSI